ncbi:hypothetical protein J3P85_19245 [Pseudomonas sp. Z1-12]|uniref:hypothetical protein n=1 Tax=Pseudomonas sp. Z1-12 TaxID=2817408 RepID=UPI003DAA2E35
MDRRIGGVNVQFLMKRVVADLSKLDTDMSQCTKILCEESVPERYLEGHPFGLVADNLRFAEKKLREVGAPLGREKELNTLLRAVAKARSVAAMNNSLIRQRTIVPNIIESDIDLEGLKTLTTRNTQRLIDQVG